MNAADKKQLLEYCYKAKGKGINKIYAHWTAGRYNQVFDDYHACIKGPDSDGELYFMTDDLSELKDHTYHRNSNAIGLSLCCAYGATAQRIPPDNFGDYPPTAAQVETLCETIAIMCKELNIPINIQHVMTHAEAGDNKDGTYPHEAYGPDSTCERWDLWHLQDNDGTWKLGGDIIRGKAAWYQQNL